MIDEALQELVSPGDLRVVPRPSPEEARIWLWYNRRQRAVSEVERVRHERRLALAIS